VLAFQPHMFLSSRATACTCSVFLLNELNDDDDNDVSIYGWQVTSLWVNCPLWVSQLDQLSLSSLQGQ